MRLSEFKESILELYQIAKASMSTVWFWIPVLFALYIPMQLYLMFVNPLLLLIVPAILAAYLVYRDDERFKARYQLGKNRSKTAGKPAFWDVEEYAQKNRDEKTKK